MFRLLLLALVLAMPASEALQCYLCSDGHGTAGVDLTGDPALAKVVQSCADFDAENPDPKFVGDCPADQSAGCLKFLDKDGNLWRTCSPTAGPDTCESSQPDPTASTTGARLLVTACSCSGELCNSAGLASPALLLLTASLLAALLKA